MPFKKLLITLTFMSFVIVGPVSAETQEEREVQEKADRVALQTAVNALKKEAAKLPHVSIEFVSVVAKHQGVLDYRIEEGVNFCKIAPDMEKLPYAFPRDDISPKGLEDKWTRNRWSEISEISDVKGDVLAWLDFWDKKLNLPENTFVCMRITGNVNFGKSAFDNQIKMVGFDCTRSSGEVQLMYYQNDRSIDGSQGGITHKFGTCQR